ncbi:MAG: DinB family protein [Acidobacteriota bacterium]|nr:DinB family protein [Acidobacteriota bacterium]
MKKFMSIAAMALAAATSVTAEQQPPPPATPPAAQQPQAPRPPVPLETGLQNQHRSIRGFLAKSAEMMTEADYGFKPTPAQRTFGELVAHIAQANFGSCSAMLSQPTPVQGRNLQTEAATAKKADIVKWLNDSLVICDQAYGAATAANVAEIITTGPNNVSRGGRMSGNTAHNNESYGTMVVYLRLKGHTPPSSEGR